MYVAIGDIHADCEKLDNMMMTLSRQRIRFKADTLVFLGDYVDGGNEAKDVIEYLMGLQEAYPHWVFLMGNHEDMLLSGIGYSKSFCRDYNGSFRNWYYQGGQQTAQSYEIFVPSPEIIKNGIPNEHLKWMYNLPFFHETEDFIFVHAGLEPNGLGLYLHPKDSDPTELLWNRWWYKDYTGKTVIYGHTCSSDFLPTLYPQNNPTSIGIDTMHHGQGYLTAALLDKSKNPWYTFVRV